MLPQVNPPLFSGSLSTTPPAVIVPVPPALALTQEQSAVLMADQAFTGRVKVCCLQYANYIMNEATDTPAHNSRMTWARRVYQMPGQVAIEVTSPTVMDAAVQAAGTAILDPVLQTSVETTVNKLL